MSDITLPIRPPPRGVDLETSDGELIEAALDEGRAVEDEGRADDPEARLQARDAATPDRPLRA